MWTACPTNKVSCKGSCTFDCYKDGHEVKVCYCTCEDGVTTNQKTKFWYACDGADSENCHDSDDCKTSPSSDDCKKDRLWESQEKDCKEKSSESSCESCCETTCKKYHDPNKCNYWYKDCVDDVSIVLYLLPIGRPKREHVHVHC